MKKRFSLSPTKAFESAKNKKLYNEELFAVVAPKYDSITRFLSLGQDQSWKQFLYNKLPDLAQPQCLDLACGTGDISYALASKYAKGRVVGLDLTKEMIALAQKNNTNTNLSFVQGDMCELSFQDASFDIVTGGYALRNAPDLGKALRETYRVLRPGGTAAFLEFSKFNNRFMQKIQYGALYSWGSLWGLIMHGSPQVYSYIARSLRAFPERKKFHLLLEKVGFSSVVSYKRMFGLIEITIVKK